MINMLKVVSSQTSILGKVNDKKKMYAQIPIHISYMGKERREKKSRSNNLADVYFGLFFFFSFFLLFFTFQISHVEVFLFFFGGVVISTKINK